MAEADDTFRFGEFEIDTERHELRRAGRPVRVEPKVFDLLRYLIDNRGGMVPKDELLEAEVLGRARFRERPDQSDHKTASRLG